MWAQLHTRFRFHFLTFFISDLLEEVSRLNLPTTKPTQPFLMEENSYRSILTAALMTAPILFVFQLLFSLFRFFLTLKHPVQYNYKNLNGGCITNPNSTCLIKHFFFHRHHFLQLFFFPINQCTHRISLTQLVLLSLSHMWYVFFSPFFKKNL